MRYLLPIILFFTSSCFALDEQLIDKLDNEDFDVRRTAVIELIKNSTSDDVEAYLKRSSVEDRPEVAYRLRIVAVAVFTRDVTLNSQAWLKLHGTLPFIGQQGTYWVLETKGQIQAQVNYDHFIISWTGEPQFLSWDVIVCIDGKTVKDWSQTSFAEGQIYQLTVHRYHSTAKLEQGFSPSQDKDDYDEVVLPIKAVAKDQRLINPKDEESIIRDGWIRYLTQYGWLKPDPQAKQ